MESGAYVHSLDAVRDFRAALVQFMHESREAVGTFDLELRRALEWVLESEPKFWQQEIRRREDGVTAAKVELERKRATKLPGGGTPSCLEERKALDRARLRRQQAEETLAAMRRWGGLAERETSEYSGRSKQLSDLLDADLPRAIALLDRALTSLEAYAAIHTQPSATGMAAPTAETAIASAPKPDETDQEATP